MCDVNRYVSFLTSFRGVEYVAKVTSVDEGVEIALPDFGTFENLVSKSLGDLSEGEIVTVAAEERERCLFEGIQRLRGDLE